MKMWWKAKDLNPHMRAFAAALERDVMSQVESIDRAAATEWALLEEGMKWRPPAKKNF